MVLGAILSAAGSLAGPALSFGGQAMSSAMAYKSQMATNEAQIQMMQQQIAYQKEAAKHAHQWEVDDLRKAGLNPILSSKYGGASVGSIPSPNLVSPGSPIAGATESAMNSARLFSAELKKAKSEIDLNKGLTFKAAVDAGTSAQQGVLNQASAKRFEAEAKKIQQNIRIDKATEDVFSGRFGAPIKYLQQIFNKR